MEKTILVTGGSGFIGSNFIKYLLTDREVEKDLVIINLDKNTYAGSGKNIGHMGISSDPRYSFIKGDISDKEFVMKTVSEIKPDLIFNFAAESHVDRSIDSPENFFKTNIIGATNLFEAVKELNIKKMIQISTDEVYGSADKESFDEHSRIHPTNIYSSTKAAADLIGLAYFITHQLPIIITRSSNNYGPYQFPEKILPLFITNLILNKKVPLMHTKDNPGLNVRDWLHVKDNCRAIWFIAHNGKVGEIYNIPGKNEKTNIEITKILLEMFNFGEEMIDKIAHRKAHDFKYSIKGDKLEKLGFQHKYDDLEKGISETVRWYKENKDWWTPLKK